MPVIRGRAIRQKTTRGAICVVCAHIIFHVHRRFRLNQCRLAVADPLLASHDFAFRNRVNVLREGPTDEAADNQRLRCEEFSSFFVKEVEVIA